MVTGKSLWLHSRGRRSRRMRVPLVGGGGPRIWGRSVEPGEGILGRLTCA